MAPPVEATEIWWQKGLAEPPKTCYPTGRRPRQIVVGRLFCCRVSDPASASANPRRVTAMACTRSSALSEHKPKSDPADARRLPAGLIPRWAGVSAGQHRRSGTAPVSGSSPYPRPVGPLPVRPDWQGSRPAHSESSPADPHVDNRRFVTRHLVNQQHHQMRGWLTMASSHTARCAAAGRRSGGLLSQGSDSEGVPLDS